MKVDSVVINGEVCEEIKDSTFRVATEAPLYNINGRLYIPKPPEPQFKVGDKVIEDKGIGTVDSINQDGQMQVSWEGAYQYSYYELTKPHTFDALRKVS